MGPIIMNELLIFNYFNVKSALREILLKMSWIKSFLEILKLYITSIPFDRQILTLVLHHKQI